MKSWIVLCLGMVVAAANAEYRLWGTHDKASPVYQPGEPMVFTLRLTQDGDPVEGAVLKWERTGDDGVEKKGELELPAAGGTLTASTDEPGFVRIFATVWVDGKQIKHPTGWDRRMGPLVFDGGACVAPETLKGIPEPKDFDAYWAQQKKISDATPMKVLEKKEVEGNDKVVAYDVKIACAGGMPVSGYLVMPRDAKAKSLAAEVAYQGYGVRSAHKNLAAGEDKIFLEINAHGIENGKSPAFYQEFARTERAHYGFSERENADPDTTFFNGMAHRVIRSLDYVKSLPEWNGEELRATGGSQGGMQSLIAAGLDSEVTYCQAWSPWNCDLGRTELDRIVGDWYVRNAAGLGYYDPINLVQRANPKCRLEIIANLGDYVCPPSGVWIAYNHFPGPKKLFVRQGCEHGYTMPDYPEFVIED